MPNNSISHHNIKFISENAFEMGFPRFLGFPLARSFGTNKEKTSRHLKARLKRLTRCIIKTFLLSKDTQTMFASAIFYQLLLNFLRFAEVHDVHQIWLIAYNFASTINVTRFEVSKFENKMNSPLYKEIKGNKSILKLKNVFCASQIYRKITFIFKTDSLFL